MAILSSTGPTIYFDNCLVGAVVKNDHPDQMPALSALLRQHELGVISAVASTEVLGEIGALPEQYQGPHLQLWSQLQRLPGARFKWIDELSTSEVADPDYVTLSGILPDEMDRRHMFHAVKHQVSQVLRDGGSAFHPYLDGSDEQFCEQETAAIHPGRGARVRSGVAAGRQG